MSQTAVKLERNGAKPALTARTHSQRMLARTRARLGVTGGPERRQLRVIEGGTAAGHAWFATIMLLTLVGGLLLTLLVNRQLAEGTYERSRLVNESSRLTDRQEALTDELDALRAPASLAKQALSLGMVSAASPAFISLSDGRILGVAEAATAEDGFQVITQPAPLAPAPVAGPDVAGASATGAATGAGAATGTPAATDATGQKAAETGAATTDATTGAATDNTATTDATAGAATDTTPPDANSTDTPPAGTAPAGTTPAGTTPADTGTADPVTPGDAPTP